MEKKQEIIGEKEINIPTLTGKRKHLFDNMRILYPKGKKEAQMDLCQELHESRIDHYLENIFSLKIKNK